MRWIGMAMALGLALVAVHVEPPAPAFALISLAVWCLARTRPATCASGR